MSNTHYLADFLRSKNYIGNIKDAPLNNSDILSARFALALDKDAFFMNALMTFGSCINSVNKQNYSWAFVQSYYALFYLAKSLLAERDVAIYYSNSTAYKIKISNGEQFQKRKGNSHEVVLSVFEESFSTDIILSNTIDGQNPIEWFKTNREYINYRANPFSDPNPPIELYEYKSSLRKWIYTYLTESDVYSFAKEHAYIAFVCNLINRQLEIYEANNKVNLYLTSEKYIFLKNNIQDNKGPIDFILRKIDKLKNEE